MVVRTWTPRGQTPILRKISGKLAVIWDGSPIHRGHEISRIRYSKLGREASAENTRIL
jgi:hypothetical protein